MSYEISLARLLENKDTEIYGRLLRIRKDAQSLLSYTHGKFPYYTPHDFSHSTNVEENLNWLVPDQLKEEMNAYELFFLIVSAWLHDWGLVGEEGEDSETIREEHHVRTEANFDKMYSRLNLSEHEARIVGRISKGHRKVDLSTEEYDDVVFGQNIKIRRRFLAALLRIADECDITHNRTPEVIYYSINPKGESEQEFKKHLNITGIGQLGEKHKIYIDAIARDPKGARTLREVAQKIQSELNAVKGILAQNGVPLDLVELRLETRGFIDKPIGFEINRMKIVDLLVGDHLYGHSDVAIRELVQNSIDSCKLRETLEPGASSRIVLRKDGDDRMVIEDNGLGMDYYEAKQFLSTIGSSFYDSELFKQQLGGRSYSPIAQYGIGILSCFLLSNSIMIETLKEGHEACRFSVESVNEEWRYEKGSLRNPGTRITLELNENGRAISLGNSLQRYFLCPAVPIEYAGPDGEVKTFESAWTADLIHRRFMPISDDRNDDGLVEMLNLNRPDYDVIVCTHSGKTPEQLFLFNHGIYVGRFYIVGLQYSCRVYVNLKANLLDLHISRENVKRNDKLDDFVYLLFTDIFRHLMDRCGSGNKEEIIALAGRMLDQHLSITHDSQTELLRSSPFMKSFLDHAPFPILSGGEITFVEGRHALNGVKISVYNCCSDSLMDELNLLERLLAGPTLVINPYNFPSIWSKQHGPEPCSLLMYVLAEKSVQITDLDLRKILISESEKLEIVCPELLPDNVRLATFRHGLRPLVVVYKQPVVELEEHESMMGKEYWANVWLWKVLLDREPMVSYMDAMSGFADFCGIKAVHEPIVYLDASDAFLRSVLDQRKDGRFDNEVSEKIQRYFKYLSYLPMVAGHFEVCLIFLEVIDRLEAEIADCLNASQPLPLFQRMGPDSKIFIAYFRRVGANYMAK
jgi:hypothetical protein